MPQHLLDPTLDLNFKRLFGASPELLSALINAVRWRYPPITVESIRNSEIAPEDVTKKLIVLDILARDANGQLLNIEMQARPHMGLPARLMFYLARVLVNAFGAGEDYHQVPPVIGITLLDFDLFAVNDQALWIFEFRDVQRPDIVLDRTLSLHLVEMPKAERLARNAASQIPQALADWLTWFRHANEENIMQQIQTPEVHKAHQRLHTLSANTQAWTDAAQRESALSMEATLIAQAERDKAAAKIEGQLEGQVKILRRQLQARFGKLPSSVEAQLHAAEPSQLEQWAERVLSAETLDHVLNRH